MDTKEFERILNETIVAAELFCLKIAGQFCL